MPRFLRLPHTLRGWLLVGTGGVAVADALAGAFVYFVLFPSKAPPPLSLTTSSPGASSTATQSLSSAQIPGTWTIASGSVAGYRVREQLAFLQAPDDAVGRTSSIRGSAVLSGSGSSLMVTSASFTVDVSSLSSDQSMRDQRIHSIGLESDQYPTATFRLTSPLPLPTGAANQVVHVSAVGTLTIHGTSKTETIPLTARVSGSQIEVVGSVTFPWSDFGMQAPSVGGFVSVTSTATMEFDVHLRHS